jgi:cytochrome P450
MLEYDPGQPVIFVFPSGNRDPREFADPDRFWIRRRAPRMLGYLTEFVRGISKLPVQFEAA